MKRLLALLFALLPAFASAQTYTIAPPPFLTAFDNVGHIINNACVWTYLAGTTTGATTYSTSNGTANANPIRSDLAGRFTVFLSPGVSYKFVYESPCTPPAHGTTLRTADNVAAVPTAAANVDVSAVAGEGLSAGDCAYLSDGSGSKSTGQWYKCDSGNTYGSSAAVAIGMVPTAISVGLTGSVRIGGRMTGLSVSAGSTYYASTSGAITTTAPTNRRQIGIADSATSLLLVQFPSGVTNDGTISGPLKGYGERWQTASIAAGVVSINYALGNHVQVSLNANITSFMITNLPASGLNVVAPIVVYFIADGTPRTVTHTLNAVAVRFPGAVAPTMTSASGKWDTVIYRTFDAGSNWFAQTAAQNQ